MKVKAEYLVCVCEFRSLHYLRVKFAHAVTNKKKSKQTDLWLWKTPFNRRRLGKVLNANCIHHDEASTLWIIVDTDRVFGAGAWQGWCQG